MKLQILMIENIYFKYGKCYKVIFIKIVHYLILLKLSSLSLDAMIWILLSNI
jgi:hypothetical protein